MAQTILMAPTKDKAHSASIQVMWGSPVVVGLCTNTGEAILEHAELCRVVAGVIQDGVELREPTYIRFPGEYIVRKGETSAPIGVFCES